MIYLFSGNPGNGKSYHAAQTIYNYLRYSDRLVITNYFINQDVFKTKKGRFKMKGSLLIKDNSSLTPELLRKLSVEYFETHKFKESSILLVMDEAQMIFNAREWNIAGRKQWTDFFTNHRHFGYDIILITQFDRMLDKQIREIVEFEHMHRKVQYCGIGGRIISFLVPGSLFCNVKVNRKFKLRVGVEFFRCRKKIYQMYDSYANFEASQELLAVKDKKEIPAAPAPIDWKKLCSHEETSAENMDTQEELPVENTDTSEGGA